MGQERMHARGARGGVKYVTSDCMTSSHLNELQRVHRQAQAGQPRPARCPFDLPKSIEAQVRPVTERPDGAPFQAPAW